MKLVIQSLFDGTCFTSNSVKSGGPPLEWKKNEHFTYCQSLSHDPSSVDFSTAPFPLPPLLVQVVIECFLLVNFMPKLCGILESVKVKIELNLLRIEA